MPDYHYHANHISAPARGSKRAALKDARDLHVGPDNFAERVDGSVVTGELVREHGVEFPLIVRCYRDCRIVKSMP
jgi:hypothetical protein